MGELTEEPLLEGLSSISYDSRSPVSRGKRLKKERQPCRANYISHMVNDVALTLKQGNIHQIFYCQKL